MEENLCLQDFPTLEFRPFEGHAKTSQDQTLLIDVPRVELNIYIESLEGVDKFHNP